MVSMNEFRDQRGWLEGCNILALPARGAPRFLLVAHYDTVDHSPGADDNASALAVALEVSSQVPSAAVLLPDLEERDLIGSRWFVQQPDIVPRVPALVLESVGYWAEEPNSQSFPSLLPSLFPLQHRQLEDQERRGNFWALLYRDKEARLGEALLSRIRARTLSFALPNLALDLQTDSPLRDFGRSDHLAFWEVDWPCLMVTDTANFRNPHYHQPSDTGDTLNYREMARLTEDLVDWLKGY